MVRLGTLLRRSPRDKDDKPEEAPARPAYTGPPLMVLIPDVAGVSSFRVFTFWETDEAARFVMSLPKPQRERAHAFWALQDEPAGVVDGEDATGEATVLIRASEGSDLVYVVSFVDIDSAQSFARFEVKRGMHLGLMLVYWASMVNVVLTEDGVRLVPESPPRIDKRRQQANGRKPALTRPAIEEPPVPAGQPDPEAQAEEMRRIKAEAEEHQRIASEAEELRQLLAEEEARQRATAETEEQRRLEAEAEERRIAAEAEERRISAEAKEQRRLEAEAEEQRRLVAEAEQRRLASEFEEQRRLAAEAEERRRLEAEAEERRIAAQVEEQRRLEAEAEERRLAAEVEEQRRLAAEAEEQRRLAAEADEHRRLQAEAEEQRRIAAEAEAQIAAAQAEAEAEEQRRLDAQAEEWRRQADAEEQHRREAEENARLAAEAEEGVRLAAEKQQQRDLAADAEMQRLREAMEQEQRRIETEAHGGHETEVPPEPFSGEPEEAFAGAQAFEQSDITADDPLLGADIEPPNPIEELLRTESQTRVHVPSQFARERPAEAPEEEEDASIADEVGKILRRRRWEKRESPFDGFKSPPGRF